MRRPPISTLFPYTTLFRSFKLARTTTSDLTGNTERMSLLSNFQGTPEEKVSASRIKCIYGRVYKEGQRSEEHTSELQSHVNLVCRLLLEKKKKQKKKNNRT